MPIGVRCMALLPRRFNSIVCIVAQSRKGPIGDRAAGLQPVFNLPHKSGCASAEQRNGDQARSEERIGRGFGHGREVAIFFAAVLHQDNRLRFLGLDWCGSQSAGDCQAREDDPSGGAAHDIPSVCVELVWRRERWVLPAGAGNATRYYAAKRLPIRKNSTGSPVLPLSARPASASPIAGANLKPCPEKPAAIQTFS